MSDGFILMEEIREIFWFGPPAEPRIGQTVLESTHGEARIPLGCFFISGESNVLIDVGYGPREDGGFMMGGNLLSYPQDSRAWCDSIDVVAFTHLHVDHVGWLGNDAGEPTFSNAQFLVSALDWEYFIVNADPNIPLEPHVRKTLLKLRQEGRITFMDGRHEVAAGITRVPAPGHTPGHSVYVVEDSGQTAVVLGDAFYCADHVEHPDWQAASDADPEAARRTRERLIQDLRARDAIGVGTHFPGLEPGRLDGDSWQSVQASHNGSLGS